MYEIVRAGLIEVLTELQELSGHPITEMDEDTCPFIDLPGFDSMVAAEAIIYLSARFDHQIEPRVLVSRFMCKPATIKQMTENLVIALEGRDDKDE